MVTQQKNADLTKQDTQGKETEENVESAVETEVVDESDRDVPPDLKNVSETQLATSSASASDGQKEVNENSLKRFKELEAQIQKSLHIVRGENNTISYCLKEIRDNKLYKNEDFETWKDYVVDRFPFTVRYANYQITFVEVIDLVIEKNNSLVTENNSEEQSVPLPTNEAQTRALSGLGSDDIWKAWTTSCEVSNSEVPNRQTVAEVARKIKAENKQKELNSNPKKKGKKKSKKTISLKEGDFAYITKVDNDEQRAYVGYWGKIEAKTKQDDAIEVEYSLSLPQGSLTLSDRFPDVPSEAKLVKLKLKGAQKKSWNDLHKRLTRIYQNVSDNRNEENFKEPIVLNLLEYFGRQKQDTFITDLESDLLRAVEDKLKLLDKPFRADGDENISDSDEKNVSADREGEIEDKNESKGDDSSSDNLQDAIETEETPPDRARKEQPKPDMKTADSAELTTDKKAEEIANADDSSKTSSNSDSSKESDVSAWKTSSEFADLTGISESRLKKTIDKRKKPNQKTISFLCDNLPINARISKEPYRYRVLTDRLLSYDSLIEKYPKLTSNKSFLKLIEDRDRKISEQSIRGVHGIKKLYRFRLDDNEFFNILSPYS